MKFHVGMNRTNLLFSIQLVMLLTQMSEQIRQMLKQDCDKFAYLNNIDRNGGHVEGTAH